MQLSALWMAARMEINSQCACNKTIKKASGGRLLMIRKSFTLSAIEVHQKNLNLTVQLAALGIVDGCQIGG